MERRILTRLGRMNRTTLFLIAALYVFLGFLLPGVVGAVLLLALAAGLLWLLLRTWTVHAANARAARLVVLALLVVVAVVKLTR
jgi:hypothetical protein